MIPQTGENQDPPDSNRGVSNTSASEGVGTLTHFPKLRTAVKIDWLAVTFQAKRHDLKRLYPGGLAADWLDCPPCQGYTLARQFTDGRRENVNPDRPDMGTHVIFSGQCLNRISDMTGMDGLELLRHYVTLGVKITRLDIAVDAYDSGIDLRALKALFDSGKAVTNVKDSRIIEGSGLHPGLTLYLGARTSEAFLRCYDKAAEQGVNADWLRFELELKGSKAIRVAFILAAARNPYSVIQSIIKGHCDFSTDSAYQRIMTEAPTIVTRAKDTAADTRSWLLNVCAPSLARLNVLQADESIIRDFLAVVTDEIERLQRELSANSGRS